MNRTRRQFLTRQFLTLSSKLLAATRISGIIPVSAYSTQRVNPGDKILIGLIGAKGQGFSDLRQALKQPGVECVAICDIDDEILLQRTDEITKLQGKKPVHIKTIESF